MATGVVPGFSVGVGAEVGGSGGVAQFTRAGLNGVAVTAGVADAVADADALVPACAEVDGVGFGVGVTTYGV